MVTRLVLEQSSDWLEPGSYSDSRLLHSDKSDRILVCPDRLGQGYCQQIELRDDLTLKIWDCNLERNLVTEVTSHTNILRFEFCLTDNRGEYSMFVPNFGLKRLEIERSQQQIFKVEICLRSSAFTDYFQKFMANLSPEIYAIAEKVIQSIYRYQNGYTISNTAQTIDWVLHNEIASGDYQTFEHILSDIVYSQLTALDCIARNPISSAMKQVIGQILSCPYQGVTRRAYLEKKALKLIVLYLEAMLQPHLNEFDLSCIHQAETILRNQSVNPPTVEMLARQIGTNRFKLNQGFKQVYGMTPYGYLRYYRLLRAKRLLMTSELSIEEVAATVGYRSRSHFAIAFCQQFGINPKMFQMQTEQCAS